MCNMQASITKSFKYHRIVWLIVEGRACYWTRFRSYVAEHVDFSRWQNNCLGEKNHSMECNKIKKKVSQKSKKKCTTSLGFFFICSEPKKNQHTASQPSLCLPGWLSRIRKWNQNRRHETHTTRIAITFLHFIVLIM